jgi:hypothetical protein
MLVAQQQGNLGGGAGAAPTSEYAPPRLACVPRSICIWSAAACVALDGVPPAARKALEQALWCKAAVRLLLLPPTSVVLHKLGACRISSRYKPYTEHALLGAACVFFLPCSGELLKPSHEDAPRAKRVTDLLHKALCGKDKLYDGCSLDRVCVSGSRGRRTSLTGSDVDVVLLLNGADPPWYDALADVASRIRSELGVSASVARCARMH